MLPNFINTSLTATGMNRPNNSTMATGLPQIERPASQVEIQLSALATEAEEMNVAVSQLEQRLYLVLRDAEPEATGTNPDFKLVSHAQTLLGIRERFGAAYSRLNSILERLEA